MPVLPEVIRYGMTPLGMKPMGGTAPAIKTSVLSAEESLRYAMSLAVAISGMNSMEVLKQDLEVAEEFTPMSPEEMEELRKRCC